MVFNNEYMIYLVGSLYLLIDRLAFLKIDEWIFAARVLRQQY